MKTFKYLFVGFMVLGFVSMFSAAQADIRTVPDPYPTIQDAITAANPGDTIMVAAGLHDGAVVDKESLTFIGEDGAQIIGVETPPGSNIFYGFNLAFGSAHNTKISNFSFDNMDYPVSSGLNDDVKLSHLKIKHCMVGISNVCGSNWEITHNKIEDLVRNPAIVWGNPIGINLTAFMGIPVSKNLVAFNDIFSDTIIEDSDIIGIYLSAFPNSEVTNNKIVHNKVVIGGAQPMQYSAGLSVVAPFPPPDPYVDFIYKNQIGFNDFRGCYVNADWPRQVDKAIGFEMLMSVMAAPEVVNDISRNFGDLWALYLDVLRNPITGENRAVDPADTPNPADIFNPQPPQ